MIALWIEFCTNSRIKFDFITVLLLFTRYTPNLCTSSPSIWREMTIDHSFFNKFGKTMIVTFNNHFKELPPLKPVIISQTRQFAIWENGTLKFPFLSIKIECATWDDKTVTFKHKGWIYTKLKRISFNKRLKINGQSQKPITWNAHWMLFWENCSLLTF